MKGANPTLEQISETTPDQREALLMINPVVTLELFRANVDMENVLNCGSEMNIYEATSDVFMNALTQMLGNGASTKDALEIARAADNGR